MDDLFLDPKNNTGINLVGNPSQAIFTETLRNTSIFSDDEVEQSPYDSELAMKAGATQMHEIGHAVNIGREDDEVRAGAVFNNFEVYSGTSEDDTPEEIDNSETWSIMAKLNFRLATDPMNGRYFAFSIEELSTVEDPRDGVSPCLSWFR